MKTLKLKFSYLIASAEFQSAMGGFNMQLWWETIRHCIQMSLPYLSCENTLLVCSVQCFFNRVARLGTLFIERLWQMYLSVNFAKMISTIFYRTPVNGLPMDSKNL